MATTPDIDEVARAGFTAGAVAYERGRPGYPPGVLAVLVDELGIGPGRDVLDLAAGTGTLTRSLVATGARVVAVEPLAAMAAHIEGAEVLEGTAEAIPLPDSSVDVVTVGQAFHWFDRDAALAEVARVLRPGGGVGLVWNRRDTSISWVADLEGIFHDGMTVPYDRDVDWLEVLRSWAPEAGHVAVSWEHEVEEDGLVARLLSTSYVAVLDAERQAALEARLRDFVAGFPALIRLPTVADVFWCRTTS